MKKRPSRLELLANFFPELKEQKSRGEREQIVKFNTVAVGLILGDQINQFDRGYKQLGPGVLVLRIKDDAKSADYLTLAELKGDEELVRKDGHVAMADNLLQIIEKIDGGNFNFEKAAAVMLVDSKRFELLILDREDPAASVKAMFEEFT